MKVLFVYKYLTLGGCETVLRSRLDELPRFGIEAHAWFLESGPGRILFRGVEDLVHVGDLGAMAAWLAANPVDVVSTIDTPECLGVVKAARSQPRTLLEVHTPYAEGLAYLDHLRPGAADAAIVPTRFQLQVVRRRLRHPLSVEVVPNPVRREFAAAVSPFEPPPPQPIVAWIGRLDTLKNWPEFIYLARELLSDPTHPIFWIIGRGDRSTDSSLRELASDAGVLEHLRWFRGVAHDRLPRMLDAIRDSGGVVLSTSRGDSFGMTMAEAMARSCAVVVPSEGPFGEFIGDGAEGLHYRLGRPSDAAAKVSRLLADDALREGIGHQGRRSILAIHSPEAAVAALAQNLRALVQPKASLLHRVEPSQTSSVVA